MTPRSDAELTSWAAPPYDTTQYDDMEKNMSSEADIELAALESAECGYIVTPGFTYCRACGGGGLDVNRNDCLTCHSLGEIPALQAGK